MDSTRVNFNKCGEQVFSDFIKNINDYGFVFKAHNPADDSVLQDRYTYNKDGQRISIVYETKAQTLIITAPQPAIDQMVRLLPKELTQKNQSEEAKSPKQEQHGAEHKTEPKQNLKPDAQAKQTQFKQDAKLKQKAKQEQKPKSKPKNDQAKQEQKTKDAVKPKKEGDKNKKEKQASKPETKIANTFTIKKVEEKRFDELLKKVKANKNMRYKLISSEDGARAYLIRSESEKATLRFGGGNVQLGGTRGDLYSELQLMMSQISDYKTAINSHIRSTGDGKKPGDVERQLKKKLPAAFDYLSEQSKIDLAIGIIDINNSAVVLSDYSTLLIPCFRGLERLIFDLQHAQGIVVKMIGQAYEKEDGNYVLKSGYRRKIPSVIYAEVMAALYTEYFKQRNFYAHSDGGYDNLSRIISDKQQVQNIFNHILDVINYNGKKLKEIGFRIN